MPKLAARIETLSATLNDPNLYLENPAKFDQLSQELNQSKSELEKIEHEWLELEEKKAILEQ